jgi:hypothetical protein
MEQVEQRGRSHNIAKLLSMDYQLRQFIGGLVLARSKPIVVMFVMDASSFRNDLNAPASFFGKSGGASMPSH